MAVHEENITFVRRPLKPTSDMLGDYVGWYTCTCIYQLDELNNLL